MFRKKFVLGVNYLCSKNSTRMWQDFDAASVEKDLIALRNSGVKWVRLFPLWDDFQPPQNSSFTDEENTGVCTVMADRLEKVMDLCFKYGFKAELVILTCIVNNENCVPEALQGKNIFTDPVALMWEQKFIKYIVTRFAPHPALGGWSIGNGYSALYNINSQTAAQYSWTAMICNAVKVIDKEHPVVSGLDTLSTQSDNPSNTVGWQIIPHAQSVDILTTHPYPAFRQRKDRINTMRPLLHSCAENSLFEDIGGKMCFIEEIGIKGYEEMSEEIGADFIRGGLLSSYIHGCHGYFWQNAFDEPEQDANKNFEYGLLCQDRSENALGREAKRVMTIISQTDLPKYKSQAVCVIPLNLRNGRSLAANVMCLATQNDIGVQYCSAADELPESRLYIVPEIQSEGALPLSAVNRLFEKAKRGSVVYMSIGGNSGSRLVLDEFNITERPAPVDTLTVDIDGTQLPVRTCYSYNATKDDRILATFSDGTPAVICRTYGRGKIIISLFSAEAQAARLKGAFERADAPAYRKVYSLIIKTALVKPLFYTDNPFIGTMEHEIDSKRSIISLMNYSDSKEEYTVASTVGYHVKKVLYGELDGKLSINEAVIFEIEKY